MRPCVQALNVERSYGWVRAGLITGGSEEEALEKAIRNGVAVRAVRSVRYVRSRPMAGPTPMDRS